MTGSTASYYIQGDEIITHYTNGKIIKSVQFQCYEHQTVHPDENMIFDSASAVVSLGYSVNSGQIVQGTPARESFFAGLVIGQSAKSLYTSAELISMAKNTVGFSAIGAPVVTESQAGRQLALFWNNGATWVKVGGTVDTMAQTVSYTTSRLGNYQIRQAMELGDVSLVQVYPRIITPNGDGYNDVVIFQFGEGGLGGKVITGEIFDLSGARVADIKPGPDPATTLMWDGKTNSGQVVPGGIYIYQLNVNGQHVTGSVVVAK